MALGIYNYYGKNDIQTTVSDTELEVGYWIGVPFWGNGYIPEAVRALQKHAFENLGCFKI